MAKGIFNARGTISANADTAVIAAPTAETIYIRYMTVMVSAAGTTSRLVIENGQGGAPLARMATATADAMLHINYTNSGVNQPGCMLSPATALNFETTGGAAATIDYDISYEIK